MCIRHSAEVNVYKRVMNNNRSVDSGCKNGAFGLERVLNACAAGTRAVRAMAISKIKSFFFIMSRCHRQALSEMNVCVSADKELCNWKYSTRKTNVLY